MPGKNKRDKSKAKNRNSGSGSRIRRARADAIQRARQDAGNIGEIIDLFLETSGNAPLPAIPLEKDQSELRKAGETGNTLPPRFGRTRIVLLTRDPEWIYAWWEVTNEKLSAVSDYLGSDDMQDSTMVLRVHDVTDIEFTGNNSLSHFDIAIEGRVSNWYIHVPRSGSHYCVELGLLTDDDRFIRMARSNVAAVPRGGVSMIQDEQWTVRDEEFIRLYEIAGGNTENPQSQTQRDSQQLSSGMGLQFGEMRDGISSEGSSSADIISRIRIPSPMSSEKLYSDTHSSETFSSETPAGQQFSSDTLQQRLNINQSISSETLYSGTLQKTTLSPNALSSEALFSGAFSSDELSSRLLARGGRRPIGQGNETPEELIEVTTENPEIDDFFLAVNTELILYGVTEPSAKVTVKGHPIQLRPDGTFTLRFSLPDGEQHMEVIAVKHNGNHRRSITPAVKKWTEKAELE